MIEAALFQVVLAVVGAPPHALPLAELDVLSYDVDLQIDLARAEIRGTERIRVRATSPLSFLTFPHNGIEIGTVQVAGATVEPRLTDERIQVPLARPLAPGRTATVELTYVARSPRGVKFRPDGAHSIFFTCHWMVCREEPGDKATLTLAITVPAGTAVVAAGAPDRSQHTADGRIRQVWRERRPYSPYLFAFAVGRFARTVERHGGATLEFYAADVDALTLARLFADTGAMVAFFERKAGLPLPSPVYRQVLVEGDEAQEATSFSLLGSKTLEPRLQTPEEDWAVAHELAHQFWGNLVTCADWSHFWLNEGLTVFMVAAWKEHRWGRAAYDREMELARKRRQVATAAGFDVPLAFAGDYPSPRLRRAVVYSKGALFLATLRETMGDGAFWSALRVYTRRFAGRTVSSVDFQRVFAAATPKDLRPLFDAWVYPARR